MVILGITAAGLSSLCFIWSWATDSLKYKFVYSFLLFLQIASNFSIKFVATDKILYAIEICVMTLCLGGHFTLLPNVLRKIYGEQATELYGYMFSYYGLCYICLFFLQNAFLDETNALTYEIFFFINGGISALSSCVLFIFFKE